MEDREPFFTLKLKTPTNDPALLAWLEECTKVINHALEVTYREEFDQAKAEIAEAYAEWCIWGTPIDTDAIMSRYESRLRGHEK